MYSPGSLVKPHAKASAAAASPSWPAKIFLGLLLAGGFLGWVTHRHQFDDAYISYRYALNLAHGEGLVFNPGERVEGYSNFLWILILAAGERFGIAPHVLGPALGVLAYLALPAMGWLIIWIGLREWAPGRRWLASALLLSLLTSRGVAASAGSGLETFFYAALSLGALAAWAFQDRRPRLLAPLAGILLAAAALTRPEGVITAAALTLLEFMRLSAGAGLAARVRGAARLAWLPGLAFSLQTLLRLAYYDSFLPNPVYAKGMTGSHLEAGLLYLRSFVASYPVALVFALAAVVLLASGRGSRAERALAAGALLIAAFESALVAWIGGDFMEYRLALHFFPLLVVAGSIATAALWPLRGTTAANAATAWAAGALLLALTLVPFRPEPRFYMQSLREMDGYVHDGTQVGLALRGLPPGMRVATTLIGTIGYFSGQPILDLWGLVDLSVRTRAARPEFVRGHLVGMSGTEAVDAGADLYLQHPHRCACDARCLDSGQEILLRLPEGDCVRAFVTSQSGSTRASLCARRDVIPVFGADVCR
jgi:arabinofuranosyltransferase